MISVGLESRIVEILPTLAMLGWGMGSWIIGDFGLGSWIIGDLALESWIIGDLGL